MKRLLTSLMAMSFIVALGASAFAQSSGNFTADIAETQCTLATDTGTLGNGLAGDTVLKGTIKTPNSSQTALLITPSLVTGLFTNTNISGSSGGGKQSSSATAQIQVQVTLDNNPVPPATNGNPSVTYDERFQQISTNLFNQISECTSSSPCNLDLLLSTLSAHSFNFVAPSVGGGTHTIEVTWTINCYVNGISVACSQSSTTSSAAGCVGPGTLTIQQVQNFSQDSTISIQ
jgi:hypothetical protein